MAPRPSPAVFTAEQLATAPLGEQPEVGGLLACLLCGRAFRQLGQHVVRTHWMPAGEYRRINGLAAGHSLHCTETRRARVAHGVRQWREDESVRARLRPTRTTADERAARARAGRRETAGRAGVVATMRATGLAAAQAWLVSIDDRYTARTTELGYPSIGEFLRAVQGLPAHDVAHLLNASTKQIWALRRRYGFLSSGGGRPPGLKSGERRVCMECGRSYAGLGQHVALKHHLAMAEYRKRHPLLGIAAPDSAD